MADEMTVPADINTSRTEAASLNASALDNAELPSLRGENERLKLELDNAHLRAELAQLGKPWWRKGAIVTTLTAIVAAIVPVTTAVHAHYQKERELVLQESKQAHEIRTSYLDRLDKPGAKMRTLRFVKATTTDPALKSWAKEEEEALAELARMEVQLAVADVISETGARSSDRHVNSGATSGETQQRSLELKQLVKKALELQSPDLVPGGATVHCEFRKRQTLHLKPIEPIKIPALEPIEPVKLLDLEPIVTYVQLSRAVVARMDMALVYPTCQSVPPELTLWQETLQRPETLTGPSHQSCAPEP